MIAMMMCEVRKENAMGEDARKAMWLARFRAMSQAELDGWLDRMAAAGKDDTPEFETAYEVWEGRG